MAAAGSRNNKRIKSLAAGRPKNVAKKISNQSSKATRSIIRAHHRLSKELTRAEASRDSELAERLRLEIEANGGLQAYQAASITGQSVSRGGDSSETLLKWLHDARPTLLEELQAERENVRFQVLEVGALSTKNALSTCGLFDVHRIDLESQERGILKQDFMKRPLPEPSDEEAHFDMISLSLVLNFVPDAPGRGDMLRRTCKFLRQPAQIKGNSSSLFPSLFLVLPAPCVDNSRYFNEEKLRDIMESLGFENIFQKHSAKLVYYFWRWHGIQKATDRQFSKAEINPGKTRNNFTIVLT